MNSNRSTSRTHSAKPDAHSTQGEAQSESPGSRLLVAFAGSDSIETGLWLILALLLTSVYCIALLKS